MTIMNPHSQKNEGAEGARYARDTATEKEREKKWGRAGRFIGDYRRLSAALVQIARNSIEVLV